MCPHDTVGRRDRDMPLERVMALARQAQEMGVEEIHPHFFGEPTMYPQYAELLGALGTAFPDIRIAQYTNGWGLLDHKIRAAILANVARLVISVDGADYQTMRATRPGLNPLSIEAGVKALWAERRGTVPHITLRKTQTPQEDALVVCEAYRKHWAPFCDRVVVMPLQGFHGFINAPARRRPAAACDRIFFSMVVAVNENVVLCCDDYGEEMVMGNAAETPLADIWKGDAFQRVRSLHMDGKAATIPMCARCSWQGQRGNA